MARPPHNKKRQGGPRPQQRRSDPPRRERITAVPHGQMPKWVREEIVRSTPKERREPALAHLSRGMEQFADERYPAASAELRKAKQLAPRSATVRELLGLSAYRSGQWEEGLRELRTFRRISGDLVHMPVEMDCLRALGRGDDVRKTWQLIEEHDVSPTVSHEARVVYASFLLDEGETKEAWRVIKPGRLVASPTAGELRRWYVAARVAIAAGDQEAARRLVGALDQHDPEFEGIDELRRALQA